MKTVTITRMAFALVIIALCGIASPSHAAASSDKVSMAEVRQEVQDMLQTLKAFGADQRDEAVRRTRTALEKLDTRIDALERRIDDDWEKMDQAARQKARAGLKTLRRQRNQISEWYGSLKSGSADAWEQMKEGFSKAYRDFYDSWEKSEESF